MESEVIANIATFTLDADISSTNPQRVKKNLPGEAYELYVEQRISWESENNIANRLTKPPLNIHSFSNLVRTDAKSSATWAEESSRYMVMDAKALVCQGVVAMKAGSSFDWRAAVIPLP